MMLYNYLKIAFRRLIIRPVYSGINIVGLTLGLVCFLLTSLYVIDELSYDKFWLDKDRIYRISTKLNKAGGGNEVNYAKTYPPLLPILQSNFDEIETSCRLIKMEFVASSVQNRFFESVNFIDSEFLNVFDVTFLEGSPQDSLSTSYSIVLTKSQAERYFPSGNALNQSITLDGKHVFAVTGIIKDIPKNTHLPRGMLASMPSLKTMYSDEILLHWRFPTMSAYVKLAPNTDSKSLDERIDSLVTTLAPDQLRDSISLSMINIQDIRKIETKINNFDSVALIATLSALVLLMACINTVNLATARGQERSKEAGLRKSIGATRQQLFWQFLTESYLTVFISVLLALIIAAFMQPWFAAITTKNLIWVNFINFENSIKSILLVIFTGLFAGLYPAVVMSNFKPVDIFKGTQGYGQGSFSIRKLLVVVQFMIAITLCVGTYVFYKQMNHIKNTDLGFKSENIVVLQNMGWTDIRPTYNILRNELLQHGEISSFSGSISVPGKEFDRVALFHTEGQTPNDAVRLHRMATDFDFFETYEIKLLSGRLFSREFTSDQVYNNNSDSRNVFNAILNKSAAKQLGWYVPSEAVGKVVYSSDNKWNFDIKIVGVVDDFHILAGHGAINPYVFIVSKGAIQFASIRITGTNISETLSYIDDTWNKLNPNYPIVRSFLKSDLNNAFSNWERNFQIMLSISILAISIAAIGSVGMASYTATSKTKEIGMRKVVGASTYNLVLLLVWDLTKPLLFACSIALPLSYYLMSSWLNGFAYRIELSIGIFIAVFISSLVLCWSTVSFHAFKIAATSPAQTFKHI